MPLAMDAPPVLTSGITRLCWGGRDFLGEAAVAERTRRWPNWRTNIVTPMKKTNAPPQNKSTPNASILSPHHDPESDPPLSHEPESDPLSQPPLSHEPESEPLSHEPESEPLLQPLSHELESEPLLQSLLSHELDEPLLHELPLS
jgi:hypothetical protein